MAPSATSPNAATIALLPAAALATFCEICPVANFLLSDGGDNFGGVVGDLLHALRDRADCSYRTSCRTLDRCNFSCDVFGRLGGLHREQLHLRSDHRETPSGVTGARRLYRRVEREEIGLCGNVLNELHDIANAPRDTREGGDIVVCKGCDACGVANDFVGLHELMADMRDRVGQLVCSRGGRLNIRRGLV